MPVSDRRPLRTGSLSTGQSPQELVDRSIPPGARRPPRIHSAWSTHPVLNRRLLRGGARSAFQVTTVLPDRSRAPKVSSSSDPRGNHPRGHDAAGPPGTPLDAPTPGRSLKIRSTNKKQEQPPHPRPSLGPCAGPNAPPERSTTASYPAHPPPTLPGCWWLFLGDGTRPQAGGSGPPAGRGVQTHRQNAGAGCHRTSICEDPDDKPPTRSVVHPGHGLGLSAGFEGHHRVGWVGGSGGGRVLSLTTFQFAWRGLGIEGGAGGALRRGADAAATSMRGAMDPVADAPRRSDGG